MKQGPEPEMSTSADSTIIEIKLNHSSVVYAFIPSRAWCPFQIGILFYVDITTHS